MKKSIISLVLILAVCISCFACSKAEESNSTDVSADASVGSTSTEDSNSLGGASAEESSAAGSLDTSKEPSSADDSSTAPDSSVADSSAADSSAPESSKPDSSGVDSGEPEISEPDSSEPESSVADSSIEDSSEESSYVPKDLSDPMMEIPKNFGYEPIDEYFNDSVFIGYSIMMHFGRYVNAWRDSVDSRIMGNAVFCAGVSMSFTANETKSTSDPETPLPKYMGVPYHFEDLPKAMGAKTMVLGLTPYSDMKLNGSSSTCAFEGAEMVITGLEKIKAENPGLNIVVLSGTYNTGESPSNSLNFRRVNNANIREYNNYVLDYCNEVGIDFIDVSTPMTNGYGYFLKEWSSDESYHILQDPYKIWVQLLRDYASKKQAGAWKNIETMPKLGR